MFDIYTIIFLALAVFIFFRLRSVLGQRTGRERPPYDPYSARDAVRSPANNDKIVTLPQRPAEPAASRLPAEPAPPPVDRWKDVAEAGSSVAAGLDAIAAVDQGFDAKHFITGARAAYEMIVTAFAEGDRRQLRSLLSREVYDGFDAAIGERESRGETAETRFVSIDGSTHNGGRAARAHRADHGAFRFQAHFGHARPDRQCDRRERRKGHRRDRRLDLRARSRLPRSQLEGHRNRSRTVVPMPTFGRAWLPVAIALLLAFFATAARCARARADQIPGHAI